MSDEGGRELGGGSLSHCDAAPEAEQLCSGARSVGNTAWGTAGLNSGMQALEKAQVPWRHHLMVGSHDRGMHSMKGETGEVFRDFAHFYNIWLLQEVRSSTILDRYVGLQLTCPQDIPVWATSVQSHRASNF